MRTLILMMLLSGFFYYLSNKLYKANNAMAILIIVARFLSVLFALLSLLFVVRAVL